MMKASSTMLLGHPALICLVRHNINTACSNSPISNLLVKLSFRVDEYNVSALDVVSDNAAA